MSGSGAAGGLAGELVALGGVIEPGFDLVADGVGLFDAMSTPTWSLRVRAPRCTKLRGQSGGGVSRIASEHDIPVAVICGFADDDVADRLPTYSLTERYGLT